MTTLEPLPGQTSIFDQPLAGSSASATNAWAKNLLVDGFSRSVSRITDPDTKEESLQRVASNVDPIWKAQSLKILENLCKSRMTFDLDDVAAVIPPPSEPRYTGDLMKTVKALKWCRQSGVSTSKRPSRHGGYIAVYESMLYSASE
jgi:hypothetical protein